MPADYKRWTLAQFRSREASEKYANFKELIFPLEKTKTKFVLNNMWKYINLVRRCHYAVPPLTDSLL